MEIHTLDQPRPAPCRVDLAQARNCGTPSSQMRRHACPSEADAAPGYTRQAVERPYWKMKLRADDVGIFPDEASIMSPIGAVPFGQDNE